MRIIRYACIWPRLQYLVANTCHASAPQIRLRAAAAGAVVASQALPARLNAVIRPLMTAVKAEADEALQDCAVAAVVALLPLCAASGRRGVCGKLVRNLCHFVAASVPLDTVPTRTRGASNALRSSCGQYGERVWIEFPELHQFVILPLQSAATAAGHLLDVIAKLSPEDSGQVFDWAGEVIAP